MTDLRQQTIEAGAAAYLESWVKHDRGGKNEPVAVHVTAALDAMLDCLEANADEWQKTANTFNGDGYDPFAQHFIAALRDADHGT